MVAKGMGVVGLVGVGVMLTETAGYGGFVACLRLQYGRLLIC